MRHLSDWSKLVEHELRVVGVEYYPADQQQIITQFHQWSMELQLSVYFWNPGYSRLMQVVNQNGQCRLQSIELGQAATDIVQWLLEQPQPGIFLLEGAIAPTEQRFHQLTNAFYQATWNPVPCYWVLLAEQISLPPSLQGLIPVLTYPLPGRDRLQQLVNEICDPSTWQDSEGLLVRACQGLSEGELVLVLKQALSCVPSVEALAEWVLDYKVTKLQGRGLELISEPDVPNAAGMELLNARLDRIGALLDPSADRYGLRFPKGMILWGPPGTGKSLAAKLAAQKMGVPLLAADWVALRGATAYESEQNLRFLLTTAEAMAPCVLYFDDFDKGFAGWNSDADGGVSRRLSQKLLTWMQEHQSPVFVMATVNRLGTLPVELQRRVDDIFFVDLPHDGARYEVFNLHLAKYFPEFQAAQRTSQSPWSEDQWRLLLTDYRLCTPAEIANAVRRVAEETYYELKQSGQVGQPLKVNFRALHKQRWQFTPAMIREENQMLEIRNNATFAQPVSGSDNSRFARPHQELFESIHTEGT